MFNIVLMYKFFIGILVSYGDYFKGNMRIYLMGVLGGIIWCVGMFFSIIVFDKVGLVIFYGLG